MTISTRTYTFTDGTTAYGSQVETEIGALSTLFNSLDAGTTAWSTVNSATFKKSGTQLLVPVQIIQSTTPTAFTTTSTSFVNSNLSASITPISTTSKILVMASALLTIIPDAAFRTVYATIARGSTNLGGANGMTETANSVFSVGTNVHAHLSYYDNPATLSSTTYNLQIRSSNGAATAEFGDTTQLQVMILIEYAT